MKIPTILSALLAASLAFAANAAPSSLDDFALLASVTKYDHHAASDIVSHYNKAVPDHNSSSFRSNAVVRAAPSKDIIPFCAAISESGPSRTRIFRNQQICDQKGWRTMFVFTAHTKKDKHHAAYPVCIGSATKPDRSIIQTLKSNCSGKGWKHESTFYYSGRLNNNPSDSLVHESTMIWPTAKNDRMMFYPYYEGKKHGWNGVATNLGYRTRWRLATTREMAYLKADLSGHEDVHKSISISSAADVDTQRCAQNLIQFVSAKTIDTKVPTTTQGKNIANYVTYAKRDECSKLVNASSIQFARVTKKGMTSIEVVINKKVYAAVSVPGNTAIPEYYIHLALQESVRTGKPIPVSVDKQQPEQIVALVAGTIATFGGKSTFQYRIPSA
ncbi:MAG: hypothetical protein J3R72DRAFT_431096 [Linnemannia gamsii]|nr:MAG: hypothetical protein J3R72DRAFT_431096 [Linnemannia gamsii]